MPPAHSSADYDTDLPQWSTTPEECDEDVELKFWRMYEGEWDKYDRDFLKRENGNMGIMLTFAGLFSAVNSTFIIGTQPNPVDTTNTLILQLINITVNGSNAVNINNLSSPTIYSSSTAWAQGLAYASLMFSLLAAFGVMMWKEWLMFYKFSRATLKERCLERQRKLDSRESWRLTNLSRVILLLLQISLALFTLSLSVTLWFQQKEISMIVISITAFSFFFYISTISLSVLDPDNPFQSQTSAVVNVIIGRFTSLPPKTYSKSSCIRWILKISTDPGVVAAAAPMIPRIQWPPNFDASLIYTRLADNFAVCLDQPELSVTYSKAMAHLHTQLVTIGSYYRQGHGIRSSLENGKRLIRDAFMDGRVAWDKVQNATSPLNYMAEARTALRTMVVHGMGSFLSRPNDERLIWEGDFQWRHYDGNIPQCTEFDWVIDYLAAEANDESEGDALLALSAMHGLGSPSKQPSYIKELIRCMGSTKPPRVRYAALRAVSDAREELSFIDNDPMPQGVTSEIMGRLSKAVLSILPLNDTSEWDTLELGRVRCYLRLIFALARSDRWRGRLINYGHFNWCIPLLDEASISSHNFSFLLTGIFGRIKPSDSPAFRLTEKTWHTLVRNAWKEASELCRMKECMDALPALVTATQEHLLGLNHQELADLAKCVNGVLEKLSQRVEREGLVSFVVPGVRGLYDELQRLSVTTGI